MKRPIPGVAPAQSGEAPAMIVWPSVAIYPLGRTLGQLYAIEWPNVYIFRLGHLIALAAIPLALVLYFLRVLPWIGIRYLLTNQRVVIQRGLLPAEERAVGLGEFDTIDIEVLPGQAWYDAGDLVFKQDGTEVFRLPAVSRPDSFRETCRKSRMSYVGVQRALQQQPA